MPVNLHPEVQPQTQIEDQDRELASYGGWQEQEVQEVQQPAQSKSAEPLPLLDEDDRVTPEQVQQDRPWWLRPTPRMIVAGGAVMALLYVLFSLFGLWGGGASSQKSPDTLTAIDPLSTNQEVEERLKQLQSENEELKREKLVGDPLPQSTAQPQKGKPVTTKQLKPVSDAPRPIAIPPRPRAAVPPPPPRPLYVTRSVAPSPLPRPITRPISSFAPRYSPTQPAASATTQPSAAAKMEPELNPQEQWLAAANRGHYVAPKGDPATGSQAQPASYTQAEQTSSYPMADSGDVNTDQASGYPSPGSDDASTNQASHYPPTESDRSASDQSSSYPSTASDTTSTDQATSYPPTGPNSSTSNRAASSSTNRSSRDIPTYEPLNPRGNATSQQPQTTASLPQQNQTPQNQTPNPVQSPNPTRLLDIGSTAEAVLADSIAWTSEGQEQNLNLKYLLRLESGFKNRLGAEILPKGSTLIAQITGKADSGFFYMEVTQILQPNGSKTPVPKGALQVVAEDGSPLKAGLEKKGRRFLANAASILAPGVERAMDSVADSAESLVLKDGDRSVISSNGKGSNPIASGISGLANGASKVVTERLEPPKTDTAAPYFKFPGGKTVRVYVNEDVQL